MTASDDISRAPSQSVDEVEIARFSEIAAAVWDPSGPMAPLHRLNPVRIAWIRDRADDRLGGLRDRPVLDVGCGAGLLAEPLARLGARVTGIDASAGMIEAARAHAQGGGLAIDYRRATAEELVDRGERFDLVIASEVVEHVADVPFFLACLGLLTSERGMVVLSTLSRTVVSLLGAKLAAEYLLGWLPRGTHDWRRFLTPAELARELRRAGLRPLAVSGVGWNPADGSFRTVRDPRINYLIAATRA